MKFFAQKLILIGFVITMVEATAKSDEGRLLTPGKGLFVTLSEVDFSAESDYLVIPYESQQGVVINKQRFGTSIAEQFEDISEVDNISINDEWRFIEQLINGFTKLGFFETETLDYNYLTVLFRTKNNMDSDTGVHPYIQLSGLC